MERDEKGEREKGSGKGREKAFLLISFLLVGALSFEAGLLTKVWRSEAPLALTIVEGSPAASPSSGATVSFSETGQSLKTEAKETLEGSNPENCPFVGSKNSDKYHLPSCSYAKRILPANRVCFSSEEEAQKKGYTAGCLK